MDKGNEDKDGKDVNDIFRLITALINTMEPSNSYKPSEIPDGSMRINLLGGLDMEFPQHPNLIEKDGNVYYVDFANKF